MTASNQSGLPSEVAHVRHSRQLNLCHAARRIVDHAEQWIGPIDTIVRDRSAHPVCVDVFRIGADVDRPFQTLLTCGMSGWPMSVPLEFRQDGLCYAELMMCLPADWSLNEETILDERQAWPVRLLQDLARLPYERNTWLGNGHTVPNGQPARPYAPGCGFSCSLIAPPIAVESSLDFERLAIDAEQHVRFYGVVPLFPEETTHKLRYGVDSLLNRFDRHQVSELLNLRRRNVCRPWWAVL